MLDIQTEIIVFIGAILTSLFIFFKRIFKHYIETITKKIKMKTEFELEEIKNKNNIERINYINKMSQITNKKIIRDGIKINNSLSKLRDILNANKIFIKIYHNQISKGFKNFSIRFESSRHVKDNIMCFNQDIPLTPFYKKIELYEEIKDYIVFTKENQYIPRLYYELIHNYNITKIYSFPIVVPKDIFNDNPFIEIKIENKDYVLIGSLIVCLDSNSIEDKVVSLSKEFIEELVILYQENNFIFS